MEKTWQFGQMWNLPNGLSLSRAITGICLPLWWYLGTEAVLVAVLWASVSDGLDGWVARRYGWRTPLGVVIDPLADKVFTNPFLLLTASWHNSTSVWMLFLVNLAYDIDNTYQRRQEIETALQGLYIRENKPATLLSKTKTAVLFLFMGMVPLMSWYPSLPVEVVAMLCLVLVTASWVFNRWR